jgi:hypothetical protein
LGQKRFLINLRVSYNDAEKSPLNKRYECCPHCKLKLSTELACHLHEFHQVEYVCYEIPVDRTGDDYAP